MAHQVAHHFQQVGQRLFFVDEEAGGNVSRADQVQRLLYVQRRVMEAGLAGDFGIMQ